MYEKAFKGAHKPFCAARILLHKYVLARDQSHSPEHDTVSHNSRLGSIVPLGQCFFFGGGGNSARSADFFWDISDFFWENTVAKRPLIFFGIKPIKMSYFWDF